MSDPGARASDAASEPREVFRWAVETRLCDEALAARLARVGVAELAASMYEGVQPAWSALAEKWALWTFVADDELDSYEHEVVAAARVRSLKAHEGGPLGETLGGIVRGFEALAGEGRHLRQFTASIGEYLDACVWEAHNRHAGATPSAAEYRRRRPHTGAMWPFVRLALAATATSEEEERHPQVAPLLDAAAWLPCLGNDLVSVDKELAAGDAHNAVIVRMRAEALDRDRALAQVRAEYEAELARFERGLESAGVLTPPQRTVLRSLVRGPDQWLRKSARYQPPKTPA